MANTTQDILKLVKQGDREQKKLEDALVQAFNLLYLTRFLEVYEPMIRRKYQAFLKGKEIKNYDEAVKLGNEFYRDIKPQLDKLLLSNAASEYYQAFNKMANQIASLSYENTYKVLSLLDPIGYSFKRFNKKTLTYSFNQMEKYLGKYGDRFLNQVRKSVITGIHVGKDWRLVGNEIQDALGIQLYKAERLARTESMRIMDYTRQEMYKQVNITQLIRLATNDRRVCKICARQHGKIFPIGTSILNHPNDRCSFIPYKQEWVEEGRIDMKRFENQRKQIMNKAELNT